MKGQGRRWRAIRGSGAPATGCPSPSVWWVLQTHPIGSIIDPMKTPNLTPESLPFLDLETAKTVVENASTYKGQSNVISDALGALLFGQLYGAKGLAMAHTRASVRRFEAVLGVKFSDHMPERTSLSTRIFGVRAADEIGRFWAIAKGDVSCPDKRMMGDDSEGQGDLFLSGVGGGSLPR